MTKVTRAEFRKCLEIVKDRVIESQHGIFGPDSTVWKYGRYTCFLFVAYRARPLQSAHPWGAKFIADQSNT